MDPARSLDIALEFLLKNQLELKYVPTIGHIDNDRAIALVKGEQEAMREFFRVFGGEFSQRIFDHFYGLKVSLDAIYEVGDLSDIGDFDSIELPYDINLCNGFADYGIKDQNGFVIHEVWHLLEQQEGVFSTHPLITEGTAQAALLQYQKKYYKTFKPDDLNTLFYQGAGYLAQNFDVPRLLDPKIRDKIQADFLRRMRPMILEYLEQKVGEFEKHKEMIDFRYFDGPITPEGLTEMYREIGAVKMAEEFQGQDLSRLIKMYEKIQM